MRKISFLAFFALATTAWAQRKLPVTSPALPGVPVEQPRGLSARLPRPRVHALGALSDSERALLKKPGRLTKVGVHRGTDGVPFAEGRWDTLPDGGAVWRMAIRSEGAAGLRIQFVGFQVGAGKVWVYGAGADAATAAPFTARGQFGNGEFWSPTIWGDTTIVEYQPADATDRTLPFEIRSIAHRAYAQTAGDPGASCNLDAMCYPDWASAVKSVSMILFETQEDGVTFEAACSASLVATRDNSLKPYLLTAGHCINNEKDARTVETFWTFQTASCQGAAPQLKDSAKSTTGASYLASGSLDQGDYSLLLLQDVPSGVLYSGWDTSDVPVGTNLVGIHHPAAGFKRILFGHRTTDVLTLLDGYNLPPAEYYVLALDNGIAQPGSSGSALFSSPGVIVGTLTYGPALDGETLCAIGSFDIGYGRFSIAYPNLKNWLEDLPYSAVLPARTDLTFNGSNGAFAGGPRQTIPLTTQAANPEPFSVRADASWLTASVPTNTIGASAPVPLTIAVDPKLLTKAGLYSSTVTILSGAAPPVYVNVRAQMQYDVSNVLASASPNPAAQGGDGLWSYTVTLRESAGVDTQVTLLRIDAVDYTAQVTPWFGSSTLPANGMLQAPLKSRVLGVPATQTIEVGGTDTLSKKTWYRVFTVSLIAAN